MIDWAESFIAIIGASTVYLIWMAFAQRGTPLEGDQVRGRIAPHMPSVIIAIIFSVIFSVVFLYKSVFSFRNEIFGYFCVVIGAFAGFGAILSTAFLTSAFDIRWNDEGIEGPCTSFGKPFFPPRTLLRWLEISRAGSRFFPQSYYLEARDGRRIYWGAPYPGIRTMLAAVRMRCPLLKLPGTKI